MSVAGPSSTTALPLRAMRLAWDNPAEAGRPLLGGLVYGEGRSFASHAAQGLLATVPAPVLSAAPTVMDAWLAAGPAHSGASGLATWRHDGQWLWGTLEVPDDGSGLEEQARRAYAAVFAALRDTGCPHLLRMWNYLPRINDISAGLERYRQFNIGRQRAFADAGRDAFEGSPAACALGSAGPALALRFLGSWARPVPLENPRQVSAYRYPSDYGPKTPSFSRAAVAPAGDGQLALFISGTASIVGHRTLHAGDPVAQARETVTNLRAVLAQVALRCSHAPGLADLHVAVYLRHPEHAGAVLAEWSRALGGDAHRAPVPVLMQADICRPDLLVEIEGHAVFEGRVLT